MSGDVAKQAFDYILDNEYYATQHATADALEVAIPRVSDHVIIL